MTKLKELRTTRGISQEALAELLGVSRQTISKWENGTVQPSADNLMRLSQVFQLPVEAFLSDDWKPPEQQSVVAAAILPELPQDNDAEPMVTPAEEQTDTDAEPAATPAEASPESDSEVPPLRRRNYRLWATLAAILAAAGIIAGVVSFNGRGNDVTPISGIGWEEVDQSLITEPVTLQP